MELENFDYQKRPYTSSKVFNVHPLSIDGINQYLSQDSFTHKFLYNRIQKNPIDVFKITTSNQNIYDDYFKNDLNKEKLRKEKQSELINLEQNKKEIKLSKRKIETELSNKKEKDINFVTSENKKDNLNSLNAFKTESNFYNSKNIVKNKKKFISVNSNFYNRSEDYQRQNYTSYNLKGIIKNKKNITNKNNKSINNRFKEDYVSDFNYLIKKNIIGGKVNEIVKKKYDGFESFNIPRLDEIKVTDQTKPTFQYTQRIAKSCTGRKKISFESSKNINKTNLIQEENEKLKNMLKIQSDREITDRNYYPKISYITSQPNIVIKKFGLGGQGKLMGKKYNPNNFQAGRDCEKNARNYFGGLYLN